MLAKSNIELLLHLAIADVHPFSLPKLKFCSSLEKAIVLKCYKIKRSIYCLDDIPSRQKIDQVKC